METTELGFDELPKPREIYGFLNDIPLADAVDQQASQTGATRPAFTPSMERSAA